MIIQEAYTYLMQSYSHFCVISDPSMEDNVKMDPPQRDDLFGNWSEFLDTDPEVLVSIPRATRFSEK
jgi:hypothetical protein